MKLMQIHRIYKKTPKYYNEDIYDIHFKDMRLMATRLHAFKVKRRTEYGEYKTLYLPANRLKVDDQIFVDDYTFTADGSLITKERWKRSC